MAGPYYDNVQWPGADGIRVPTEVLGSAGAGVPGGTMSLDKYVLLNFAAAHANVTLTQDQTAGSVFSCTNASGGGASVLFPVYIPGKYFVVSNSSGQTITFLVTGKTGISVVNTKSAILFMDAVSGDVQRVTADTAPGT